MLPFLLVSSPALVNTTFGRSVVFVWQHDENGAVGVIINQPSVEPVLEHIPEWESALAVPLVVFFGGPVEPETAVGLAQGYEGSAPVGVGTALVDLSLPPPEGLSACVRVFSGYTGWAPDQLDAELEEGAWLTAPAFPEDLTTSDPDILWSDVIDRLSDDYQLLKTMPAVPRSN